MTNTNKITKAEKLLIKGLMELYKEQQGEFKGKYLESDAQELENDLRRITGNNHMDHRNLVEEYIKNEITKEICK